MVEADGRARARQRCIFCSIVRGGAPAYIVFEDAAVVAFLDHRPLRAGHCLLMPKAHHETLADLPAELLDPLFAAAQRLARAVEAGPAVDGSFVAINNRVSQSVPHLHVHVVPRRYGDGLFSRNFVWKRQPYPNDDAARAAQEAIRSELARLPPLP